MPPPMVNSPSMVLKSRRFALLVLRQADHTGDALNFLDQVDIGQLAIAGDQFAAALQARLTRPPPNGNRRLTSPVKLPFKARLPLT